MSILSVLISSFVAVAAVLVFRALDKEKNSMDKVKRYADSRKLQFDEYFQEQITKRAGLTADIDTKKTTMVATINRVEKQIEEFHKVEQNFDGQFSAISNIEKKLNEFQNGLEELNEMTEKVEENLSAVKKRKSYCRQTFFKIGTAEKNSRYFGKENSCNCTGF